MKVKVREICEKEIEVPDNYIAVDIENMLKECDVVIGDVPEATYQVQFPHQDWITLF